MPLNGVYSLLIMSSPNARNSNSVSGIITGGRSQLIAEGVLVLEEVPMKNSDILRKGGFK